MAVHEPVLQPVDPEFAAVLDAFPDMTLDEDRLADMRAMLLGLVPSQAVEGVESSDHVVDSSTGVVVRVHRPAGGAAVAARPCVYSIHGGGYVLGSYTMDDALLGAWCTALDCVGVSVEYRLAPEHPYPTPLEDCYAGLRWVHAHADEFGIDTSRVGVAGVSAGGGLAAALALLARDRGEVPLAFQLLDSPMLDDRQHTPSSRTSGLFVWSRESNEFGWRSYLGSLYGADDIPHTAVPARAVDLSGLPPSFVSVGTADGFRDEDIDYAVRLNQAGVPTEVHVYPGAPHGFSLFQESALAKQAARNARDWLSRQLAR